MVVFSKIQALLFLYLSHIGHFLNERTLYSELDLDQEEVRQALAELLERRLIRRGADGRLTMAREDPTLLEDMAVTLRLSDSPSILEYCLGRLSPRSGLEEYEQILRFLDERMIGGGPTLRLCLDLTLERLLDWPLSPGEQTRYVELVIVIQTMCLFLNDLLRKATLLSDRAYRLTARHGNARFQPIIVILRCYLRTFIDEDVAGDILLLMDGLRELKNFEERDMQDLVAYFEGLLHYVRGEYGDVLACYERRPELQDWKYHRLADILALCACRAATMQRRFSVALSTCLAARNAASLAGDRVLAMFWRLHMVFCFVRMGDLESGLQHANSLFMCLSPKFNNKIYASTVRTIAIIHYLYGRTASAYYLLRREAMQARAMNVPYSPFEEPLMLNVLLAIEQAGFPPVPYNSLDEILPPLCLSPNRSLRSAALRTKALRLADRHPAQASRLLRESLEQAKKVDDFREKKLSGLALADQYERSGRQRQAEVLRKEALTGLVMQPASDMALWELDRCLCYPAAEDMRDIVALESGEDRSATQRSRAVVEQCGAAVRALPPEASFSTMLDRLMRSVQAALEADRALLFRMRADGSADIEVRINMTEQDVASINPGKVLKKVAGAGRETQNLLYGKGQRVFLVLKADNGPLWGLMLDAAEDRGGYLRLDAGSWREIAAMLAGEIRSALRIQDIQKKSVQSRSDRARTVAGQTEQTMLPVIGPGLKNVMEQACYVADTTASVLLLGETGVGKEVMARKIHSLSRRPGAFIAVHPASMPETLFESEFFGYEKGAFTGASQQKIGLIELADGGTLFIDEVGDVPLSIQTRLIRVLQEQSFRRVGGTRTIHSQFRLISATNKDLLREVREGRFREDLLYRISVVPLHIPALRQRREDIVPLARALMEYFCKHYHRVVAPLPETYWSALRSYDWPGNVRELKNVIERSVILNDFSTTGELCKEHASGMDREAVRDVEKLFEAFPSLDELEARYLRYVLKQTGGKVRGEDGAETVLNIRRSTLYAKLKRHGIVLGGTQSQ